MQRIIIAIFSAFGIWFIVPTSWYAYVILIMMLAVAIFLALALNEQERVERLRYNRNGEIV